MLMSYLVQAFFFRVAWVARVFQITYHGHTRARYQDLINQLAWPASRPAHLLG